MGMRGVIKHVCWRSTVHSGYIVLLLRIRGLESYLPQVVTVMVMVMLNISHSTYYLNLFFEVNWIHN